MPDKQNLSVGRNIKIGLFHLGSGMADVLTTGVWNRIMISDLGYAATPVGLLVSMRYFLAPISVWAGRMSDRYAVFGYRRLFWIWLGRIMMAVSMATLGTLTAVLAAGNTANLAMWVGLSVALLLFSLGNALSGGTFLALIYDRAPEHQRGRAVGIVWTFLLTGFAVGGAFFGILLPGAEGGQGFGYTPEQLRNLFLIGASVMASLWFFSLVGEETRVTGAQAADNASPEDSASFRKDLQTALQSRPLRMFLGYLTLSMMFAFSQDLILEPFAGDVFNMDASVTTRFAGYWGTTSIIGSIAFILLSRRFKSVTNTRMSQWGVVVLIVTFALYGYAGLAHVEALIMPGLLLLGIGLGIWNIGTLGLMMEMSPDGRAGTFLGFWTLAVTLARGIGVSGGGIIRDLFLAWTGSEAGAYAAVFILGAGGLIAAYLFLMQTNTEGFREQFQQIDTAQMMSAGLD